MKRKHRPTWLSEAMLPRTSPVVAWNQETNREVRRLEVALAETIVEAVRFRTQADRLLEEMEEACKRETQDAKS